LEAKIDKKHVNFRTKAITNVKKMVLRIRIGSILNTKN
jgi:hypothetical protein